jgi:formate/nitrite transporter FocA (FNT family)
MPFDVSHTGRERRQPGLAAARLLSGLVERSVSGKVLAIVFPITAFVAAGFEHSIANMFFIPLAIALGVPIGAGDLLCNLQSAQVYWVIYLRPGVTLSDGPKA